MQTTDSIANEQLAGIIRKFFGYLPPIFASAQKTPQIQQNLYQQTIAAYIHNPIPLLFKEQLFSYLSRYCSVSYSIIAHSCALHPLGMTAGQVLTLLETLPPTDLEIGTHLRILATITSPILDWPERGSEAEHSLFLCTIFLFLLPGRAIHCRIIVRQFLGDTYYNALIEFLSYIKTCHFWVEAHPELSPETDQRVQNHLAALVADEPELINFFQKYNERAALENEHIMRDHLARKHIEEKLRASEDVVIANTQQLEATFEAMTDGVVVYDAVGNMLRLNSAYRRMIAIDLNPKHALLSPDERGDMLDLHNEADEPLPQDQRPVARMLRGEVMTGKNMMDIIVRSFDGKRKQLNVSGAPMRDQTGKVVGGVIIFRDVTQRRQLERRTHETLEGLLAIAETIVYPFDGQHQPDQSVATPASERLVQLTRNILGCQRASIIAIEPETETIHPVAEIGLSPELHQLMWASLNGIKLSDIVPEPALRAKLHAGQEYIIDTSKPPYDAYPNPFGSVSILVAPLWIDKQLVGMLSFDFFNQPHEFTPDEIALTMAIAKLTTLVIERERLLRERTEAQANELALLEANRRMDEFMGIASHELKTPLTTIKGYVQLVARRLKNSSRNVEILDLPLKHMLEGAGELLERTDTQIERLGRLVNELLDISRVQANRLEFHLEHHDLATIVRDAVQDQLLESDAVRRTILVDIPTEQSFPIIADADRIGQVVSNYLSNALKYSAEQQPVDVSLQHEGSVARVLVSDKGPGLSLEEQQHIWDRFYRARGIEVLSGSGIGLGLGLYICRTIIERHNGQVGVESTPGLGSTFWFTLPLA